MARVTLFGDLVKHSSLGLFEDGTLDHNRQWSPPPGHGRGNDRAFKSETEFRLIISKEVWSVVDNTFEEGQRLSVTGRIVFRLQENSLQPGGEKKDEA